MYTIISYRENGHVFRGGYCEGRTDSDFRLGTAVSREDALDLLARAIFRDMVAQNRDMNEDYDFTESAEIILGVNGYFGEDHSVDDVGDEVYDSFISERTALFGDAQTYAAKLYSDKVREDREEKQRKAQQNADAEARRQETFERNQLAELKKKYEGVE